MGRRRTARARGSLGSEGDSRAFEEKLGHTFADASLLLRALTHPSLRNELPDEPDYERLEFLGDAVLSLLVGLDLFRDFPDLDQGGLTRARAALVNEACLAMVAREAGIGPSLRLAKGEHDLGGREKPSILSDSLEAVIAAVFLDGGFDEASALVRRLFGPLYARAARGELGGDMKTALGEKAWERFREAVRYVHVGSSGPPHDPTFEVEVALGEKVLGRGRGRSKKDAEQEAARAALEALAPSTEPAGGRRDGEGGSDGG